MAKVSVIIPTYNREKYICETIDSVLSQTYKDYEIVVVDDGSTDETGKLLLQYGGKIKYIYKENGGTACARNLGILNSEGEFIAFLDDDDLWLPEKLKIQMEVFYANPDLGFVCSQAYVIDVSGVIIKKWGQGMFNYETFESLYEADFVLTLTVLAKRRCINEVGLFDEQLLTSEDYDLWLRLAKKYRFKHINLPLAKYRLHRGNKSKDYDLRLRAHQIIDNKYNKDIGFLRKKIKTAKDYFLFGTHYYSDNNFYKAAVHYLKAILNFPLIGYYYWPKEVEGLRFSLPYRVIKVYLLVLESVFKKVKNDLNKLSKRPIVT